jgi:hypothetical protein
MERRILDKVKKGQPFYFIDLLPYGCSDSEYKALHRAMTSLTRKGLISSWHFLAGVKKAVIAPVGSVKPDRPLGGVDMYDIEKNDQRSKG